MSKEISTIMHVRGSRLVYVPKGIVKTLNIKSGDVYKFSISGNKIIMTPLVELSNEKQASSTVSNQ